MRTPRLRKEQLEASATDFVVRLAFLGLFAYWSLELVRPFHARAAGKRHGAA